MPDRCWFLGLICLMISTDAWGAEAQPLVRWDFGAEESTPLQSHGGVHRDVPGPRPPDYPDFEPNNTAIRLDGNGAHLSFEDTGIDSPFDFTVGNAITLEAWVQVTELRSGENVYVIGKGRTGSKDFAADNQNWALRVRESGGKAGISFLFATPKKADAVAADAHWHRWNTVDGFKPGKDWHHIAVSYRFGEPASLKAWIDGKPQTGAWDMGGPSVEAPVVDNDAIWIGSAQGGAASNSFRGALDSIAVYRQTLDDATMKTRFRFTGKPTEDIPAPVVVPEIVGLQPGKTLFVFHEGMPSHNRWLNVGETLPAEIMRWQGESFLMNRLPQRYDAWGIRDHWKPPVLTRIAADVPLPMGQHRFLMRVRGLSRLWVNGQLIASSKPLTGSPSGEEPMTPVAEPPLPGLRVAEHRQQEVFGEATVAVERPSRVILETMIGGKDFRTDPGEMLVAVQTADGRSFALLPNVNDSPAGKLLTDHEVMSGLEHFESTLAEFDDQNRRTAAATQDDFWKSRHEAARAWLSQQPAIQVPTVAPHPIDAFLKSKMDKAVADSAGTPIETAREFHSEVFPILRDACIRCHGEKANGGLQLNSREAVLKSGDSGTTAVVPGDVAQGELLRRIRSADPEERMPPGEQPLNPDQIAMLEKWIQSGAGWPAPPVTADEVAIPDLVGPAQFLRRVYLDTIGVPPSESEVKAFLADTSSDSRKRVVDELLANPQLADHWVSYWQDLLAENPTMVNPSLNTTGPFRWFLYDSLRDHKPIDRMVTELMLLRGSPHEGGSAGFGLAGDNDAPFAAKGQIVANAFLGIELQCARCHDSPYHSTKQKDLYSLAAMFEKKPVTVPKTSRVPAAFFEKQVRESLIQVTLSPDESVPPAWPFEQLTGVADNEALQPLMQNPSDSRERLAALVTAPQNSRFARVIVNRVWRRLIGAGLVEPVHDWEGQAASHPELLDWLAREFVAHDYDLRHLLRTILTSSVYQRQAVGRNLHASAELRFFNAPERRRLSAEQVVDSLHVAAGLKMDVEEFTLDPDGRRPSSNRLTLGVPSRAWMLASLANERDRPTLGLPKAQAIADVMEAFGWSGSRQNPRTDRETAPNVLQPGILANSTASVLLTRASAGSELAELAVTAGSPQDVVNSIFLRYLNRYPTESELRPLLASLEIGFEERLISEADQQPLMPLEPLPRVTWSNHLRSEGNLIAAELERRARMGPPADPRLREEWREVYEDAVWSVINIREFVWIP